MIAAKNYPLYVKEVADLKATINKQNAILNKIYDGSAIMLGTLEAIKEHCNGLEKEG